MKTQQDKSFLTIKELNPVLNAHLSESFLEIPEVPEEKENRGRKKKKKLVLNPLARTPIRRPSESPNRSPDSLVRSDTYRELNVEPKANSVSPIRRRNTRVGGKFLVKYREFYSKQQWFIREGRKSRED